MSLKFIQTSIKQEKQLSNNPYKHRLNSLI